LPDVLPDEMRMPSFGALDAQFFGRSRWLQYEPRCELGCFKAKLIPERSSSWDDHKAAVLHRTFDWECCRCGACKCEDGLVRTADRMSVRRLATATKFAEHGRPPSH
jgi:hypothetical protein